MYQHNVDRNRHTLRQLDIPLNILLALVAHLELGWQGELCCLRPQHDLQRLVRDRAKKIEQFLPKTQ